MTMGRLRRDDRGLTLAEMLVTMSLMAIGAAIGFALMHYMNRFNTAMADEAELQAQQLDATTALLLDVTDGAVIEVAAPDKLVIDVVRPRGDDHASNCERRTWQVVGAHAATATNGAVMTVATLQVTTERYSSGTCTGGVASTQTDVVIDDLLVQLKPFTYMMQVPPDVPIVGAGAGGALTAAQINDVVVVGYDVNSRSILMDSSRQMMSAAPFDKKTIRGTHVQTQQAKAPLLTVTTAKVGVDDPVLTITDGTANLVRGWNVWRLAYKDGTPSGSRGQFKQWKVVLNPDTTKTTQTIDVPDNDLPAGWTAQYVAIGFLIDGDKGAPSSNQVVTGLRPATTTITATGAAASITVTWTAVDGATAYDVYRDGALVENAGNVTTWTDSTAKTGWGNSVGAGHAHTYAVVAVNRWERAATADGGANASGAQSFQLPAGTALDAQVGAPVAVRVASTNTPGAWTGALAPTAITATNRQPANTDDPASVWDPTVDVTWTAPAWTGAYKTAAAAATRYTVNRGATSVRTGLTAASTTDPGAPRGANQTWTVTSATIADGAGSGSTTPALAGKAASAAAITWPDAPVCSASPGVAGYATSRSVTVSASGPAGQSVDGYRQRLAATGEIRTDGAYVSLTHGTAWAFNAQAFNGGGRGPWGAGCNATTTTLTVSTPVCAATINDSLAPGSITVSGGTNVKLGSGGTPYGGPRTFTGLSAGAYTGYAQNSATDGYNTVSSGWDACPSRTITGPPATPSSGVLLTAQRLCAPAYGFQMEARWTAVPDATKYEVRYRWSDTNHTPIGQEATLTTSGGTSAYLVLVLTNTVSSPAIYLRAGNAAGWSGWTTYGTSVLGGCQTV
jgi:prepilin-type N-terminal cleavage/methylation domain-containing protein